MQNLGSTTNKEKIPMVNRRNFIKSLGTGLAAAHFTPSVLNSRKSSERQARSNFVFISSDNQSYKDMGYAGHYLIKTPNLDRIARQGVIFWNAYCGSPVCAPGRACMMTGMYPSDNNSFCNATPWDGTYPTWGTGLREAGYYTRSIGKLDLNNAYDTGFEEFESSHGHVKNPDITALFRRPLCYRMGERLNVTGGIREERHRDGSWVKLAREFILNESQNLKQPWALNVGFHQPHVFFFERKGFLALKKYYDMYPLDRIELPDIPHGHLENQHLVFQNLRHFKRLDTPIPEEQIRRALAGYYGMISELDEYVGQIWRVLEETDQLKNTIFIFTADNGMSMGEHGLFYHNSMYEESVRIPLIIAGCGFTKNITVDNPVSHVDVVATMFELAGEDIPSHLRGHSLMPLITGKSETHPGFVYSENHSEGNCTGSFMIRKGDWKYIHFTWYDDLLFNLACDPGEFDNLINDPSCTDILRELREILYSLVDPEDITRQAFKKQEDILEELSSRLTEDELYHKFEFRLGHGQARALAAKCKSRF